MIKRIYGNIKSVSDLANLQLEADKHGLVAVGITDSGKFFKLNGFNSIVLTADEAQEILKINENQVNDLIKYRGSIYFNDSETVSDELSNDIPVSNLEETALDEDSEDEEDAGVDESDLLDDNEEGSEFDDVDFIQLPKEEYDELVELASKAVDDGNIEITQTEYDELLNKATSYDAIVSLISDDLKNK